MKELHYRTGSAALREGRRGPLDVRELPDVEEPRGSTRQAARGGAASGRAPRATADAAGCSVIPFDAASHLAIAIIVGVALALLGRRS